ncbi:hypothetical protein PK28_07555 [Hymenobacter sp. DG25B]|uniref:imelysin family protein n=1 Tax=Hymenobacter sp. DG25B TaxID=1385664 RepID=UPI0005410905|nr:imelysin family protein [Hymenobacter sp. DG25B]AIZ63581.1 hypothetical protein PK28_07555 [Hymenobacter sp. DG25B]
MFKGKTLVTASALFLALAAGCDSKEDTAPASEYDRAAMLTNYSNNLIVPGYTALNTETTQLKAAIDAFVAAPGEATLASARAELQQAYTAWQMVSGYEFGPAEQQMLRTNLNIYPATTSTIESNISAGSYDLESSANLSAKGFPALDYLLYSDASATAVIARFVAQSNRGRYLQDVAANINTRVGATTAGWQSYTATFQKSEGTAVGSAVGNLVNQLNSDIDMTKRAKVGIPSGRFTAGTAQPTKVEAYYSGLSLPLLKSSLQAEKAMFLGQNAAGANGLGLDDYLDHVGAKYNNEALSAAIAKKFDEAIAATDAVQGPLSQAVTTQPQAVGAVYQKLQELIVLTKTDMPAALGVSITYTDNDGD